MRRKLSYAVVAGVLSTCLPALAEEDVYLVCKPDEGPAFEVSIYTGNRLMTVVGGLFNEPMRLKETSPNYVGIGPTMSIGINRYDGTFGLSTHDLATIKFGSCSKNTGKLF
jgi:hypothetical protein